MYNISSYMSSMTHRVLKSHTSKMDVIYNMPSRFPGYIRSCHFNGLVATHILGHMIHGF